MMTRPLGRRFLAAAFMAALLPAQAAAQSAPAPRLAAYAPLPQANPSVTERAVEWLERIQSGEIDRSQLDSKIEGKFTPATVALLKSRLSPLGKPYGVAFGGTRVEGNTVVYRYVVAFAVGSIEEYISFDRQGKLAGLVFNR